MTEKQLLKLKDYLDGFKAIQPRENNVIGAIIVEKKDFLEVKKFINEIATYKLDITEERSSGEILHDFEEFAEKDTTVAIFFEKNVPTIWNRLRLMKDGGIIKTKILCLLKKDIEDEESVSDIFTSVCRFTYKKPLPTTFAVQGL